MLVAQDAEDVDHGQPGIFLPLALGLHDGEESVESRLELRPCRQRSCESQLVVVGGVFTVGSSFELRDVIACALTQSGSGLEPLDIGVRDELAEDVFLPACVRSSLMGVAGLAVMSAFKTV